MTTPDIWSQMGYVPPRGSCGHKDSLLSPRCPCLRFMIHPLKVSSSFACDGCNHHASYHQMENPGEKAITDRWASETPPIIRQQPQVITTATRLTIQEAASREQSHQNASAYQQGTVNAGPSRNYTDLEDYQMQKMLLEQMNRSRLLESNGATAPGKSRKRARRSGGSRNEAVDVEELPD